MPTMTPGIAARHVGGRLRRHVVQILLEFPAAHAVADDVQKREDTSGRAIDDALLEVFEVAPAGAARVDDRRHARAGRHDVGIDAVVAGIRTRLAGSGVDVRVNVDDPGADEEPADIDRLDGISGIDLRRDGRNLPSGNRHVANGADAVPRIDQVAAAQQQVVSAARRQAARPEQRRRTPTRQRHRRRSATEHSDPSASIRDFVVTASPARSTSRPDTRPCRGRPTSRSLKPFP